MKQQKRQRAKVHLEDKPDDDCLKILLIILIGALLICLLYLAHTEEFDRLCNFAGYAAETAERETEDISDTQRQLYLGYDEESGTSFISNVVILFFQEDTQPGRMQEVIAFLNGEIDGQISDTCYRIWMPKTYSYQELTQLCELLNSKEGVDRAVVDAMLKISNSEERKYTL